MIATAFIVSASELPRSPETPLNEGGAAGRPSFWSGGRLETFSLRGRIESSAGGVADALLGEEVRAPVAGRWRPQLAWSCHRGAVSWRGRRPYGLPSGRRALAGLSRPAAQLPGFSGQGGTGHFSRALFADYPGSELADRERSALQDPRAIIVQYRETDLHFVRRLMAEEGLVPLRTRAGRERLRRGGQTRLARHRLVIFDRETGFPPARQPVVRFHLRPTRRNTTTASPILSKIARVRGSTLTLSSWDETQVRSRCRGRRAQDNDQPPPCSISEGALASF